MRGKLFDWVGRNAKLLVTLLAISVAANVLSQAYTHKTTPLLAWKGGGFGMYTEPHVEDRSLWVTFAGTQGAASVRLWPQSAEFAAWQAKGGLRGTAFLRNMTRASERVLYYPRAKNSNDLISLAARVRWPEDLVGDVMPMEGKVFRPENITLTVYEIRYDVRAQTVTRTVVFEQTGGGRS